MFVWLVCALVCLFVCFFNLHQSALCLPPRVHFDSQKVDVPDKRNFCPEACQPLLRHEQWHRTIAAWPIGIASGVLRGADVVFSFLCLFVWMKLSVFNRGGGEGRTLAFTVGLNTLESEAVWDIAGGEEYKVKY